MNANLKIVYKIMLDPMYAAIHARVDLLGQFRLDYEEYGHSYYYHSVVLEPNV